MKFISENCSKTTLEATKIGQLLQNEGIKTAEDAHEYVEWKKEKLRREEEQRLAEEKRKQAEEERNKLMELRSQLDEPLTHKQKKYSIDEAFDKAAETMPAKPKSFETALLTIVHNCCYNMLKY